jgi:Uma2 family endonuclease
VDNPNLAGGRSANIAECRERSIMVVVTTLPFGRPLTVDDLEQLPDDGHRYELLDGSLLVTPAPGWGHQAVAKNVMLLLDASCPPDFRVVPARFEWRIRSDTALQPDVLVARYSDLAAAPGRKYLLAPPLLAVEVLSPSTRRIDRMTKFAAYDDEGVTAYWIVDPDRPSIDVFERTGHGRLRATGSAVGEAVLQCHAPFAVDVQPLALAADLEPR